MIIGIIIGIIVGVAIMFGIVIWATKEVMKGLF